MELDALTHRKVLIVDDVFAICQSLKSLLMTYGFEDVQVAENGKVALEMVNSPGNSFYGLFFIDIRMPEMSGIELVKTIRQIDGYSDVPIIMISTENEVSTILECVESGANSYILKPFTPDVVTKQLQKVISDLGI